MSSLGRVLALVGGTVLSLFDWSCCGGILCCSGSAGGVVRARCISLFGRFFWFGSSRCFGPLGWVSFSFFCSARGIG